MTIAGVVLSAQLEQRILNECRDTKLMREIFDRLKSDSNLVMKELSETAYIIFGMGRGR